MSEGRGASHFWVWRGRYSGRDTLWECRDCDTTVTKLPAGSLGEAVDLEHTTDTDYCWCQPQVIDRLPEGRVIVHRRTADGPE